MIIGLTHDKEGRLVQRLAVDIKLAIGLPADPEHGRKAPTKLDQFIFLRKSEDGTWKIDKTLTEHYEKKYGKKVRRVDIILLSDEVEEVFPTQLAWWKASACVCWGDGVQATRRTKEHPNGQPWSPCGNTCQDFINGDCKPSGDLRFTLSDFPQLGAVARIHTSSYRSIIQLSSAIHQVRTITGGRLAGIKATLVVTPEKSSFVDKKDGQRKSTKIFALGIQIQAPHMEQLVDHMTQHAQLFEQTRKLLGTGHVQIIEGEETHRAAELAKEFYHDRGEIPVPAEHKLQEVGTLDVSTLTASPEPNRGHEATGLSRQEEREGGQPARGKKPPAEKPKEMCSECRQMLPGHDPSCKFADKEFEKAEKAEKAPKEPEQAQNPPAADATTTTAASEQDRQTSQYLKAAYALVGVSKGKGKTNFLVLDAKKMPEEKGSKVGKLYVFDTKLHPALLKLDTKQPVPVMFEVCARNKDGKPYYSVEHILEIAGQPFVADKEAEQATAGGGLFA